MKVLFLYPHGLGDNILATPALKKYKETTGNYVGWIMLKRFESAQLFREIPFVDQVHYGQDAWKIGGGNFELGLAICRAEAEKIKRDFGYDKLVIISHQSDRKLHKIHRTAAEMGITLADNEVHTHFYYDDQELHQYDYLTDLKLGEPFIFWNGETGLPSKNIPNNWTCEIVTKSKMKIISPDFTWDIKKTPIAFAAHLMTKARCRVLVDSALYHIAHALDLPVEVSYFARGREIYDVVKPLHKIPTGNESIFFDKHDEIKV